MSISNYFLTSGSHNDDRMPVMHDSLYTGISYDLGNGGTSQHNFFPFTVGGIRNDVYFKVNTLVTLVYL